MSAGFSDGLAGSVIVSISAGWSQHPRCACVTVLWVSEDEARARCHWRCCRMWRDRTRATCQQWCMWRNEVGKGKVRAGVVVVCGGQDGGNAPPLSSHVDKSEGEDKDKTARVG